MKRVYFSFSLIVVLLASLFIVPAYAQNGTSTPNWNFNCSDGQFVELVGSGTQVPGAPPTILNIPNIGNVDSIVTEVVFKGAPLNLPTSATIMSSAAQVVTNSTQIILPNFGSSEIAGVFRTTMLPASQLQASVAPPSAGSYTWAFIAYVYRHGSGKASTGTYSSAVALTTTYTITVPLPVTIGTKNVSVCAVLSELDSDSLRVVLLDLNAGGVSVQDTLNSPNLGTSLNISNYTLNNVPGSASSITLTYTSPVSLPGGLFGDSFIPAINVTVDNCPCNTTLAAIPSNVSCNGGSDGGVNLTVTGGTPPLTYVWSNGATTEDLTNVAAGIYSVTVIDANQCTASATSLIVTEPSAVNAAIISSTNVSINGGSDGTATAMGSGGTAPYTYLWSNNQTNATATGLSATTYTVTVTDANGCTDTDNITITQPDPLLINTTHTDILCNGASTGTASVTNVTGGVAPYTYLWNTNATTTTISNLVAGTYTVTVTDVNGATASSSEIVLGPQNPLSATAIVIDENCFGGLNGSIDLTPSGGTPAYTYMWSSGETTQDLIAIAGGTYTVTISDANGCTLIHTETLTEPAPFTASETHVNVLCNGDTTGSIDLTVNGGTTPYSYFWSNGLTTEDINNLAAGSYTVFVTDASLATGCTAQLTVTITEPASVTANATATDALCFGDQTGTASATSSGGTGAHTYIWSTGETTQNITGLGAGTYTVTATDANGCTDIASTTVSQPQSAVAVNITASTNVSINGGSDGTATAASSGGTSPYTMVWSNGDTGANASNLSAGLYTVTTTDSQGCTATASVLITEPTTLNIETTHTDILCHGDSTGTASVTSVTGGVSPYTYLWNTNATTSTISNLVAGTYTVTVTDMNGATAIAMETVLQPLAALSATAVVIDENCFGSNNGSIDLTPAGGTPGYTYSWSTGETTEDLANIPGGTYTVIISDANGCTLIHTETLTEPDPFTATETHVDILCNGAATGSIDVTVSGGTSPYTYTWSNGMTTQDLSNLTAGTYTLFVSDASLAAGCTAQLTVTITEPASVTANATASDALCFGDQTGTASATSSGGTGAHTYIWSTGETTQNITGLGAGTYTVTATDANGCTDIASTTVSQPQSAVAVNITASTNVSINGGSDGTATAASSGGTSPYTMVWSNGDTGANASNLSAGLYTVTTTDSQGCTATASVLITEPTTLNIETTHTDILCHGDSTGTASVTSVTGGVSPYTYLWNTNATTSTISNLVAGTYTVTVTDMNGATAIAMETVLQPLAALSATAVVIDENCFGSNNGSIDLTPAGGTPGYTYSWSTGETTEDLANIPGGTYTVIISDANGCTLIHTETLTEPDPFTATETHVDILCNGAATGSIDVTVSGGTSPYTYTWSNGMTTQDLSNLTAGTYTLFVSDASLAAGCSAQLTITISEPSLLTCEALVSSNVSCSNGNDGSASAQGFGGTSPYTYAWSDGQTTAIATGLGAGTYTVTVTDANNCTTTCETEITQPGFLFCITNVISNVSCNGGNDGSASVFALQGTPPYNFDWGSANPNALSAGTYVVSVTDANNCSSACLVTITEPPALTCTTSKTNALCYGDSSGTATVSVSGGTQIVVQSYFNDFAFSPGGGLAGWTSGGVGSSWAIGGAGLTVGNGPFGYGANQLSYVESPSIDLSGVVTSTVKFNTQVGSEAGVDGTQLQSSIDGGVSWQQVGSLASGGTNWYNNAAIAAMNLANPIISTQEGWSGNFAPAMASHDISALVGQPDVRFRFVFASDSVNSGGPGFSCDDFEVFGLTTATSGYTYSWNTNPVQTTATATNLTNGVYTVTVTDANQCTSTCTARITQPARLAAMCTSTNLTCWMSGDGAIDVTTWGGTPPYTYLWNDGTTTEDRTGLAKGQYLLTITDANACSIVKIKYLTMPRRIQRSRVITNASCFGGSDGAIDVSVWNGIAPYTFLWNDGATTEDRTGLSRGNYIVTITDANGCTRSTSGWVLHPSRLWCTIVNEGNVTCFGGSDGAASVSATGGTAPYTFDWGLADPNALAAGTYTVTVTDANQCQSSCMVTITEPLELTCTITGQINIDCNGGNIGSASVSAAGGTGTYTYSWSDGQSTATATGLTAGIYTVTVRDQNGGNSACVTTCTVTITEPLPLTCTIVNEGNVTCFGGSDGAASVSANGGTAPYTFDWGSADPNALAAGTYTVTVTDANQCQSSCSVTITQPLELTCSITGQTNVSCYGGNNGSASVSAAGGTGTYTYSWSDGQSTATATGLSAGTYTVTVRDQNGASSACVTTCTVTITEPDSLNSTAIVINENCFGGNNGSIDLTVSGGTPGYTYTWSTGATTQDLTAIPGGTYTVTITDAAGCTIIQTETLTQPSPFTATETHVDILCNGDTTGSIDLTVSGGTTPYAYFWSNGMTTQDISNIAAGPYTVFVTDASLATGCTAQLTVTLTEPTPLTCTIIKTSDASCNGGMDGSATISATGGTAPYNFDWGTADPDSLAAGTYTVTVTDANQCQSSCSVTISQPSTLACQIISQTNVSCTGGNDGSATVAASGGTLPYTYSWNTNPVQTTATATGLAAGTYTVMVKDQNGSSTACATTCTVTITEPPVLFCTILATMNVSCNGGNNGVAVVTANGGTGPYTYQWSNGQLGIFGNGLSAGVYTVTATDANLCSATCTITITEPLPLSCTTNVTSNVTCNGGNDGSATVSATGGIAPYSFNWGAADPNALAAGTYTVTVTDSNQCQSTCSVTITEPLLLTCNIDTSTNVSCNGANDGSATVSASGGMGTYTYVWTNGQTTATATGLTAGTYTVTVRDQNGTAGACITTCTVTITEPTILSCNTNNEGNVLCHGGNDGAASVSGSGGTLPYTYVWSNGQTGSGATGLTAGTYTATVTDANQCTSTCTVTITEPDSLIASAIVVNENCFGGNNGSIDLTVSGGTPGYSYAWSTGDTTQDLTAIPGGTYTVTITDANGCSIIHTETITQPALFTASETHIDVLCNGDSTGSIDLTVSGGTPPYAYFWSNGMTTQDISNLAAGLYTVFVTDASLATGCTAQLTVTITEPAVLLVSATPTDATCYGIGDGYINITVNGGTPNYSYAWSNGETTMDVIGLMAGTYSVIVTDANGCSETASATVNQPDSIQLSATFTEPLCNGDQTGTIDLTVIGGVGPFQYVWSNQQGIQDPGAVLAGTYTVTVTDLHSGSSCSATLEVTVTEPDPLVITLNPQNISCLGILDGAIDATVIGGTGAYTYAWSTGSTNEDLTGLDVGTYTLIVTDANGCIGSATTTLIADQAGCACVGDLVWVDANGNGIQDSNETGYPGLIVQLYTCDTVGTFPTPGTGTLVGTDTTDANGEYLFCDLPAGNYTVVFGNAPAGFIYTTPNAGTNDSLDSDAMMNGGKECFYLPPGDTNLTCDAGLLELASIGDFVWNDLNNDGIQDPNEPGVPGIAVCLYDSLGIEIANDTTDANGFYSFVDLVPGDYNICIKTASLPFGYIFSPQNATADSLDSDADALGCMMQTTLDPGENDLTWDAGIYQNLGCVGDLVWVDANGNGIQDSNETGYPGLIVQLYTCDTVGTFPTPGTGTLVDTDTTDANGEYLFCDLPAGNYTVVFGNAPAGFIYTTPNAGTNDSLDSDAMMNGGKECFYLPPGDTNLTCDAGLLELASIGDYVWNDLNMDGIQDSNEVGVPGIVVYLQDCQGNTIATDTTDASGNYLFDNLVPGDYKLTFDPNSLPANYVFTLLNQGGDPSLDSDANSAMGGMTMCTTLDPGENDLTWDVGIYECDIMITAIPTPITCFGDATGSIDVTVSNGIAPYTYLWNDGNTNEDRTGLVAGTYTVTVFDDNGCALDPAATVVITEPTELLAMATSTDISCYGANDGTAMAFGGGGTPNYSYEWSTGALTQSIINLGPGIYTVTVTDANNCTATATTLIIEPTPFTCNLNTHIHISCFGANDGILAVNGVGGTPGYTYMWSTGATTMSISNLGPGNYSVTVTDANNCVSTCAATILQPNPLTCSATPVTHVTCNGGNDGAASVTAAGGSAPYNFVWSNGQTGMNASGLSAAIYTITVTDNNNCTGTCTVEITEPDPVSCSILNTGNVSCTGGNDGSATVQGAGGTAPYTYDWGGADPNALAAGTYTVTVTDANGCTNTCDVTITEPTPVTCTTSVLSNVSCNGGNDGSATVQGAGGTAPYTYDWGGADPNALAAGTYTVTVTDANGCTNTCDVTITEPTPVTCTTSVLSNVSCNGGNDGSATVQGSGGTSPYTYNWGGADPNALAAGTYTVTVTDANNCSSTCTVLITEPNPLTCTATGDTVACGATDGTVSVTANGGTPNYTYMWSTGDTTATVNNLGGGVYTVTVTDANGCTTTCSAEIIDLPPPTITVCPDQEVGFMPPPCDCDGKIIEMILIYDGPAGATVNAGSNTSGSYVYTNLNTQPGDTLVISNVLIGGDWYIFVNGVADAKIHASCSDDILNNINSTKSDFGHFGSYPNPDQNSNDGTFLVIGHTDDKGNVCPAGGVGGVLGGAIANINIDNVTGGTAPFTYLWSNGATTMNQVVNIGANTTYTVTVTDANGCTATSEHTVTLVNILCSDGKVKMCDNGTAKCEDKKNVAGKLLGGYTLGPCGYDFSQPNSCGSFVQFCPCEGGIQAMGVIYNGTSGATVNFYDGSVSGSNLVQSYTNVQTGDSLLFQGSGKFNSGSNFTINGGPAIEIHLSCSQPVQGETFGGVLYVYGTLDDQGNCCNLECLPPPPVCACDGKIVTMAVIYDGPANATVTVGPNSSGSNPQIWTNVQPGDTLTAALGDIGNDWYWAVNGTVDGNIHASCSDDILLNVNSSKSDFGSLGNYPNPDQNNNDGTFLVIGHVDDKGNLCGDVGNYTPPPAPCACSGKIVEMTVIYDGPAAASVNVGPSSSSNTTSWSNVQPGDTLMASLGNIGNDWYWIVNGSQDGNIHASCSDDILGNVNSTKSDFGSLGNYPNPDQNNNDGTFLVIGHVDENGNECSIGQNVPKFYNPVYSQELFLQAYPNPTTGQLNVTFVALNNENYNLEMMDMTGRILFNENNASQIGVNMMSYDFNYLPKGVYLLQVNMKSGTERLRVIID